MFPNMVRTSSDVSILKELGDKESLPQIHVSDWFLIGR
jgi:hypothetical protein